MITLVKILESMRPGADWTLVGDEYEGLEWLDKIQPKPTIQEIEAARAAVEQADLKKARDDARRAAFQSEADPLFFKGQRGEATEQEWLDKVAEIRATFPDVQGP